MAYAVAFLVRRIRVNSVPQHGTGRLVRSRVSFFVLSVVVLGTASLCYSQWDTIHHCNSFRCSRFFLLPSSHFFRFALYVVVSARRNGLGSWVWVIGFSWFLFRTRGFYHHGYQRLRLATDR
jgi:hypothetical protein